jgi:hypothetical protein
VWWEHGSPDLNRHLAKNSLYADWYAGLRRAIFMEMVDRGECDEKRLTVGGLAHLKAVEREHRIKSAHGGEPSLPA